MPVMMVVSRVVGSGRDASGHASRVDAFHKWAERPEDAPLYNGRLMCS